MQFSPRWLYVIILFISLYEFRDYYTYLIVCFGAGGNVYRHVCMCVCSWGVSVCVKTCEYFVYAFVDMVMFLIYLFTYVCRYLGICVRIYILRICSCCFLFYMCGCVCFFLSSGNSFRIKLYMSVLAWMFSGNRYVL